MTIHYSDLLDAGLQIMPVLKNILQPHEVDEVQNKLMFRIRQYESASTGELKLMAKEIGDLLASYPGTKGWLICFIQGRIRSSHTDE